MLEAPRPSSLPMTYLPSCFGALVVTGGARPRPALPIVSFLCRPWPQVPCSGLGRFYGAAALKDRVRARGASGVAYGLLHQAREALGSHRCRLRGGRFDAEDLFLGGIQVGLPQGGDCRSRAVDEHVCTALVVIDLGQVSAGDELAGSEVLETEARLDAVAGFLVWRSHEEDLL